MLQIAIIGKTDYLSHVKVHVVKGKLLLSKLVGSITVSDKFESLSWELFVLSKCHAYRSKDIQCPEILDFYHGALQAFYPYHEKTCTEIKGYIFCNKNK